LGFDDPVSDGFYEVYGDFPEVVDKGEFPTLPQLRQVQNFEGDPREVRFDGMQHGRAFTTEW
jgi:hypothetical protein